MTKERRTVTDFRNDFKYNDYAKHISWVYHKTQILPKVVLIGENSMSVPLKNYKLRQCELVRLNAPETAPTAKELFDDHIQRGNFKDLSTNALAGDEKLQRKYLGMQNVVIIDDAEIVRDFKALASTIYMSEQFLTPRGRILFDIPVYRFRDYEAELADVVKSVRACVKYVNNCMSEGGGKVHFEIEEIKLSMYGDTEGVVGVVVYLKKQEGLSNDELLF